ncbi:MAG: hypothetical protein HOP11_01095 [Saprospiraceae bacterium]|nr:hypothetical protein [Saprospiraceae bacterium]
MAYSYYFYAYNSQVRNLHNNYVWKKWMAGSVIGFAIMATIITVGFVGSI